jgi:hypothetical protein
MGRVYFPVWSLSNLLNRGLARFLIILPLNDPDQVITLNETKKNNNWLKILREHICKVLRSNAKYSCLTTRVKVRNGIESLFTYGYNFTSSLLWKRQACSNISSIRSWRCIIAIRKNTDFVQNGYIVLMREDSLFGRYQNEFQNSSTASTFIRVL